MSPISCWVWLAVGELREEDGGVSSSIVESPVGTEWGEDVIVGEGSATLPLRVATGSDHGELAMRGSDLLFWIAGNLCTADKMASSSFFSVSGFDICAVYSSIPSGF